MFPTLSEKVKLSEFDNRIVSKVLSNEKITIQDLDIESLTGNFFKTRARSIIVIPENFTISAPAKDQLNDKKNIVRYKIEVSFSLTKGSYATIVTKRLFGH